jgi:hypothetical protein
LRAFSGRRSGIDLFTGRIQALVRDRHGSREFIEFLELRDADAKSEPSRTAVRSPGALTSRPPSASIPSANVSFAKTIGSRGSFATNPRRRFRFVLVGTVTRTMSTKNLDV